MEKNGLATKLLGETCKGGLIFASFCSITIYKVTLSEDFSRPPMHVPGLITKTETSLLLYPAEVYHLKFIRGHEGSPLIW